MDNHSESLKNLTDKQIIQLFETCIEHFIKGEERKICLAEDLTPEKNIELSEEAREIFNNVSLGVMKEEEFNSILSWMKPETRNSLFMMISNRRTEIKKRLLLNQLNQVHCLTDFDYNIKLSVASSKISDLNEPLLSLFLHTAAGSISQTLLIEMNADEVNDLLRLLKQAKQQMKHCIPVDKG